MKTLVITGASRRLGLFLAEKYARAGWMVHGLTRKASSELCSLQKRSPENITLHELETYTESSIQTFLTSFKKKYAEVDALIHNASIYEKDEAFATQGARFYESLIFIHMTLPALLTYGLADALKARNGNIISITDIYADNPNADYGLYCSTKAGLQNLTLSFAKQLAPKVRANCIQPGPIQFLLEHTEEQRKKVLNETLLACEGGFEPVYKTVEFILNNHYLTGDCIKVDGGRSLKRG